jgi:mxaJ protein
MVAAARDYERLYDDDHGADGASMRIPFVVLAWAAAVSCAQAAPRELVVCADPNNLPFSNHALQGFENKIVALLATDLGEPVRYYWWPQQRGYVRKTLNESKCDLWPGIASGIGRAATTRPYYRSTYVFVSRTDAHLNHLTLDDPRLRSVAIGVQMIGNGAATTPPAQAIARRGLIDNVRGYLVDANYDRPDPADAIIKAVATQQIDVAVVWGPVAGYYANHSTAPLHIEPITPAQDPRWPMSYDISMGVRTGQTHLLTAVDAILERERPAIDAILRTYHVPLG